MAHINCSFVVPAPIKETFEFLTDPKRVPFLLAGKVDVEIENAEADLVKGSEFSYLMTRAGISQYLRFRVEEVSRGNSLTYKQTEGIYRRWIHTQKFSSHGRNQTLVTDIVDYELPFGFMGHLLDDLFFRKDLTKILQGRLVKAADHFRGLYPVESEDKDKMADKENSKLAESP
jgi:ligand-binding SRPBCC domain-containing protein